MVSGCIQKNISDYIWAVTKTRWFMYIGGCYTTHIPNMETIIVHYKYIVYLLTKQIFIECHWWVLLPVTCQHHLVIFEALPLAQWGDRLAVWTSSCLLKAKWPWMIQFVYIRTQQNGDFFWDEHISKKIKLSQLFLISYTFGIRVLVCLFIHQGFPKGLQWVFEQLGGGPLFWDKTQKPFKMSSNTSNSFLWIEECD